MARWCLAVLTIYRRNRHWILLVAIVIMVIVAVLIPRCPQDSAYHQFADTRPSLGIPNSLNVLSNLSFAPVGVLGLLAAFRIHTWERWPYATLFVGTLLIALGSSYYHFAPDNWTLVWDRLPMTVGFMGLLTAVLAERVSRRWARTLFVPLLVFGAASVVYWYWSEVVGAGDLRPYGLVQFGSLLVVLLVVFPSWDRDSRYVYSALGTYLLAKMFEFADRPLYEAGQLVSGHTIKHLLAAAGLWWLVVMLKRRDQAARKSASVSSTVPSL
jgi:hypothetical protein